MFLLAKSRRPLLYERRRSNLRLLRWEENCPWIRLLAASANARISDPLAERSSFRNCLLSFLIMVLCKALRKGRYFTARLPLEGRMRKPMLWVCQPLYSSAFLLVDFYCLLYFPEQENRQRRRLGDRFRQIY